MALLKSLRRNPDPKEPAKAGASPSAEAVQQARQQARRRLIGAAILLGIGVIGFPVIFQTQPRPIPVDIPIEIPRRDNAPPLGAGASAGAGASTSVQALDPVTSSAAAEPAAKAATVEKAAAVERAAAAEKAAKPASAASAASAEVRPKPATATPSAGTPGTPSAASSGSGKAPPAPSAAARASAPALREVVVAGPGEAKPADPAPSDKGRFVVQAGSYTDAETVREVRGKLERMGLKTYTQVVVIEGVTRTRVRVGPYATRADAVEVQNKIKAAGVAASLLVL